jgi:hypothetical protein
MNIVTPVILHQLQEGTCPNCKGTSVEYTQDNKVLSSESVRYWSCMSCDASYELIHSKPRRTHAK